MLPSFGQHELSTHEDKYQGRLTVQADNLPLWDWPCSYSLVAVS